MESLAILQTLLGGLSKHFTVPEALESATAAELGLSNMPTWEAWLNIVHCAGHLEKARAALGGRPFVVHSWYRTPAVNGAVGGANDSDHMTGWAVDLTAPDIGDTAVLFEALRESGVPFDQLIDEHDHVHISFAPAMRGEAWTA